MTKSKKFGLMVSLVVVASCASISFGQQRFGNLRSSSFNPTAGFRDLKTFYGSGVNHFSGGTSGFKSSYASQNDLLQSSTGSSLSGGKGRYSSGGTNFGSVSLSSSNRGISGGGMSQSSNRLWSGGSGSSSAWNLGARSLPGMGVGAGATGGLFGGADPIILLPEEEDSIENSYRREWEESAQAAICPFQEKKLQRPNLDTEITTNSEAGNSEDLQDPFYNSFMQTEKLGLTTSQGSLYTAQQISMARKYVRQGKFDQALNCYQAARSVDPKNVNALIGISLSHILTGKLQAGGLSVSFMAERYPEFWKESPDFMATFGAPASEILNRIALVEPEIDQYLSTYRARDSREMADNIRLANLSKMFLAWLKSDEAGMKADIQAAAEATPLDAQVQRLCRDMVGFEPRAALKFQPLEPLE
jgi:hypothetical protein